MRGTRTALDLESEDMEDIALQVEALERYGTAASFHYPDDAESVASSDGLGLLQLESGCEEEVVMVPMDEKVEEEVSVDVPEDEKATDQEENNAIDEEENKAPQPEESVCEEGPVRAFSFTNSFEDRTAVSTLGSPSVFQNHEPPVEVPDIGETKRSGKKKVTMQVPESQEDDSTYGSTLQSLYMNARAKFRGLPCSHPCSKLEIAAVLLALTAFILTSTATDRCDFVQLDNDHLQTFWDLPERTVGLLQFETLSADAATSQCLYWFDYPDAAKILYDGSWHAARVMSVMATFFGLLLVGFISTFSCIAYKAVVYQRLAFASLIMPLFFGLSFIAFGSDVCLEGNCEVGIGGLLMVLGIIVWLMLTAVLQKLSTAGAKVSDEKERTKAEKSNAYLGLTMLLVMIFIVFVDMSVIFGRESDELRSVSSRPPEVSTSTDWLQAGGPTQGPYPDSHDFLSLSGDAKVMSLIGKESVTVMEFDVFRKLWYPFGNVITANLDPSGLHPNDRIIKFSASSASLSEDGQIIAVGSSNWATSEGGEEYEFGKVQIWNYHEDSHRWIPHGQAITGKTTGDAFGSQVKLSKDGRRLAILASGRFGKQQPYIRVYQFGDVDGKEGDWVQLGEDIMLASFWTASGFALSADGLSVALGSLRIGRLGLVTVWRFHQEKEAWNRQGSPISSESSSRQDQFGESVAISGAGEVLVVGDAGGSPSYARVFLFRDGEWEQLGHDLECNSSNGICAHDVAVSESGSIVAVTEHSSRQVARIYSLGLMDQEWMQVGDDVEIAKPGQTAQGMAIDLSSDGRSLALGVTFRDTQTQVWQYIGDQPIGGPLQVAGVASGPSNVPVSATMAPTRQEPQTTSPDVEQAIDQSITSETLQSNGTQAALSNTETAEEDELNESHATEINNSTMLTTWNETERPWVSNFVSEDIVYFLFASHPRVERFDMSTKAFLPSVKLPTSHGPANALGVDNYNQMYVGYGTEVFRYTLNGTEEVQIAAASETKVIGFHFDGNLVFINAGQYFISVDGKSNTLIKQFFSFNEMEFGTSIANHHRRIFGRTPDEVAKFSGDVIRKSDLWFKEYDDQGDFVDEKLARLDRQVGFESASKTWMFPDQTRVVDDKGYVFSVASAEHVYTIETEDILDIAWLGGEVMIALQKNGTLTAISQELVTTGSLDLEVSPANVAVANGDAFTFTHDAGAENGIRVDTSYLGLLNPSLPGRSINPTNVPFSPEFVFVDNQSLMYMLSKGHSSIFVMDPESKTYVESIKLAEIPRYAAYSGVNHEIYTLRANGVLSKIELAGANKTETTIATMTSTPLGLSTAGEFIFVCDDSGAFATHYTFLNNGNLVSSVDWNHYDEEYVWSEANRKMYFFRQADPTDLMTEHIYANGTIGNRIDSFLNTNSGFEHPIRVDPYGHHAILGSGIIHNARTLKRVNATLSNSMLDAAFGKGIVRTIRNLGEDMTQLQQWDGHTFGLQNATGVSGRAHRILPFGENKMVVLTTDATGIPVSYVLDEHFNIS